MAEEATAAAAADTEEDTIAVVTEAVATAEEEDDLLPLTVVVGMVGLMVVIDLTVVGIVIVIGLLLRQGSLPWIEITQRHLGQETIRILQEEVAGMSILRHRRGEEVRDMRIVVHREGGFRL